MSSFSPDQFFDALEYKAIQNVTLACRRSLTSWHGDLLARSFRAAEEGTAEMARGTVEIRNVRVSMHQKGR